MKSSVNKILLFLAGALILAVGMLSHRVTRLKEQRDRYRQNSEAMLCEVRRFRVDSTTTALDSKALRLTVEEYKEYRAEDAERIKRLGIHIRNLEAAARHQVEVNAPITAPVRDTVILRDTVFKPIQAVVMSNPYINFRGIIEDGRLTAKVYIPVALNQAVWVEYKRRWIFWRRVKAVHQTISCDNPYVEVKYSEYIRVGK